MYEITIWPGWLAGTGIGLLTLAYYWITGKPFGVSRNYCNMLSYCSKLPFFSASEYKASNWRLWFFWGIVLGGFLATQLASPGVWHIQLDMGHAYDTLLPQSPWLKMAVLFAGGLVMGVGSRMAGGCTSGHVIAGIPQMNFASVIAGAMFFVGGLLAVQTMAQLAGG